MIWVTQKIPGKLELGTICHIVLPATAVNIRMICDTHVHRVSDKHWPIMSQRLSFFRRKSETNLKIKFSGKSAERWSVSRTARTGTLRPTWIGQSPSVETANPSPSLNTSSTWGQYLAQYLINMRSVQSVRRRKYHLSPVLLTLSLGPFSLIFVAFSLNLSLWMLSFWLQLSNQLLKHNYTCRHDLNTHLCIENITLWYAWLLFQSHSHTIVCFRFDSMFSIFKPPWILPHYCGRRDHQQPKVRSN